MCKRLRFLTIFTLILFFIPNLIFSEILHDEKNGFAIDLVDGFYLAEKTETGYYCLSDFIPVEIIVNVYPKERFSKVGDSIAFSAKQLACSKCDVSPVDYRNYPCEIAYMEFNFQNTPCIGYLLAIQLSEKQILSVLGYTAAGNNPIFESVILSCLDSVFIDHGSFFTPGPVTSFVYPKEGKIRKNVTISGVTTSVQFDKIDAEANEYVINREYEILKMLSNTDYWFSSWQRFYQLIYRDSYGRVKEACFDLCSKIYSLSFGKENCDAVYAQSILSFVQNLPYGRNPDGSDFQNLISTFAGEKSDCDSRSLLCAILLNMMDIKSTFFVSVEYSHAMVGTLLDLPGAKLQVGDEWYVLGETTAKVDFGKVAQSMSDSQKWLNIELAQ
ncbi:MAG: hypothetical protein K6G52_08620 [Treponemataceae bacterium]|nr:hypothetical protein [Treponemataceae bacterium]